MDNLIFSEDRRTLIRVSDRDALKVLKLPEETRAIADHALENCHALKTVSLPSITEIGISAFEGCSSLKEVRFAQNKNSHPISLESAAFRGCDQLVKVISSSTYLLNGESVFEGCRSLERLPQADLQNLILPERSFRDCQSLESYEMPDSVTEIADLAFSGCTRLQYFHLSSNLVNISCSAFEKCSMLQPDRDAIILGNTLIRWLADIKEVRIPGSVKIIASDAFYSLSHVESIIIPSTVSEIRRNAFSSLPALRKLDLPESPIWLHTGFIRDCPSLEDLRCSTQLNYGTLTAAGWQPAGGIGEYLLSISSLKRLTLLGSNCRWFLTMKETDFPPIFIRIRVINLSLQAFPLFLRPNVLMGYIDMVMSGFAYPKAITDSFAPFIPRLLPAVLERFRSDPVLYRYMISKHLLQTKEVPGVITSLFPSEDLCILGDLLHYADLLDPALIGSTEVVNPLAACDHTSPYYKALAFPRSGKGSLIQRYIGNDAVVDYPSEIDSKTITGIDDFEGVLQENCTRILSVTLPEGYRAIGRNAFRNWSGLRKIRLPGSMDSLGAHCFENCTSLEEIHIPEGIEVIPESAFCGCRSLRKIILPSTLREIKPNAFRNCELLESITLTAPLESIGSWAFSGCHRLETIYLPESCRKVGFMAFSDTGIRLFIIGSDKLDMPASGIPAHSDEIQFFIGCPDTINMPLDLYYCRPLKSCMPLKTIRYLLQRIEASPFQLDSLTFTVKGTFLSMPVSKLIAWIQAHGGIVRDSLDEQTDYLLLGCGERERFVLSQRAEELNTIVLTEELFLEMIYSLSRCEKSSSAPAIEFRLPDFPKKQRTSPKEEEDELPLLKLLRENSFENH